MKKQFLSGVMALVMILSLLPALKPAEAAEASAVTATAEKVPKHHHTGKKAEAKSPTFTVDGNIEYYYCEGCKGYFRNESCTEKISREDTILPCSQMELQATVYNIPDAYPDLIVIPARGKGIVSGDIIKIYYKAPTELAAEPDLCIDVSGEEVPETIVKSISVPDEAEAIFIKIFNGDAESSLFKVTCTAPPEITLSPVTMEKQVTDTVTATLNNRISDPVDVQWVSKATDVFTVEKAADDALTAAVTGIKQGEGQLTVTATFSYPHANEEGKTETYKITASSTVTVDSGSGSSGNGTSSPAAPKPSVSTGDRTQTGTNGSSSVVTETTATPSVSTKGDTTKAEVNSAMGDEMVRQAENRKSETVVVAPEIEKDTGKTEVTLPGKTMKDLGSRTDAEVRVETPAANVTIPNEALSDLGGNQNVTVSTGKTDKGVNVEVRVGSSAVDSIPGGVKAEIPHEDCGPSTVVVVVHDDGTREVIRTSLADEAAGAVTARVEGTARLEIVDNRKEFHDISGTEWYTADVDFAASHELMQGTGNGAFEPTAEITRASMAMLLYNVENNPEAGAPSFEDTASGAWYTKAITWASENGVVNGYGDGTFGPNDNITREQMAVILYKYAGFKGADVRSSSTLHSFPDASSVSTWAEDALRWAVSRGLFQGDEQGRLNPSGSASRAEVAALLMRFCRILAE